MSRLAGEWEMVYGERDGAMFSEGFLETAKRVMTGDEVTVSFSGQVMMKARIFVNTSTQPKSIDYSVLAGPLKGKHQFGIYDVDGTLMRSCFGGIGKDRPTQFTTVMGDECTFTVWKKVQ